MKLILILFLATQVFSIEDLTFLQWRLKYGVTITSFTERKLRELIYNANKAAINEHNANPSSTYSKGVNRYSHLTRDEFIKLRCQTVLPEHLEQLVKIISNDTVIEIMRTDSPVDEDNTENSAKSYSARIAGFPFGSFTDLNAPSSVNYSYLMQPVQDQISCGACWAFAAAGQVGK